MLPRIEAREKLSAIHVATLAAGAGEQFERQQIFAELERKASGADRAPPAKASADDLAAMGIAVQAGGDLPTIGSMAEWLGQPAANPASEASQEGVNHG
jgi:hypothetical protein